MPPLNVTRARVRRHGPFGRDQLSELAAGARRTSLLVNDPANRHVAREPTVRARGADHREAGRRRRRCRGCEHERGTSHDHERSGAARAARRRARTRRPARRAGARSRRTRADPGSSSSAAHERSERQARAVVRDGAAASSPRRSLRRLQPSRRASASRPASASPRAPASAERARPALHGGRPERCDRRRRAAHRCGLRPGHRRRLGSDGVRRRIRRRRRRPGGHGEDDAQHGKTSHRSAPAPQQRPSSLSCHIPPISGPFLEATAVFGVCQRGVYAPQAGPEPVCGAPPFVIPLVTSPSRSSLRAAAPLTGRSRTGCSSPTGRLPACRHRRTDPDPRPGRARSGSVPAPTSAPSSTGRPSRRSHGCRRPRACSSCRPTGSRTCRVRRPEWPANRRVRPARSSLPDRSPGCRSRRGNRIPCCGRPDPGRRPAWSG